MTLCIEQNSVWSVLNYCTHDFATVKLSSCAAASLSGWLLLFVDRLQAHLESLVFLYQIVLNNWMFAGQLPDDCISSRL